VADWAVSDRRGKQTLWVPKRLHGSASFTRMDDVWEAEPVEVDTDILYFDGASNCLVKIDAEGAEEKIWDGIHPQLKYAGNNNEFLLEYTPGAYTDNFLDKLESYAPLHWINHDGLRAPVGRDWLLGQQDWVMLSLRPE
jgi:hypothetical protein